MDFGGFIFAGILGSQLLLNELVGSALLILDVIRLFLRLGLCTSQFLILLLTVFAKDNVVNLDLKSGETTR